jgi:hypothetical protein
VEEQEEEEEVEEEEEEEDQPLLWAIELVLDRVGAASKWSAPTLPWATIQALRQLAPSGTPLLPLLPLLDQHHHYQCPPPRLCPHAPWPVPDRHACALVCVVCRVSCVRVSARSGDA